MTPDPSWITVLPNLSIGVVSVLALVYVVSKFLAALDSRADRHERSMVEREKALREVETHVRGVLTTALTQSTVALEQNSRILSRVMRHLDGEPHK